MSGISAERTMANTKSELSVTTGYYDVYLFF